VNFFTFIVLSYSNNFIFTIINYLEFHIFVPSMTHFDKRFFLIVCLACLSAFSLLCFLSVPVADDFTIPIYMKKGIFDQSEMFRYFYHNWNGRYTSHLFSILLPYEILGPYGYKGILFVTLVIFYFSVYFFFQNIFKNNIHTLQNHLNSACFCLLFLNIIPGTEETIYWWSGSVGYTWPLIFQLFWFSVWLRWSQHSKPIPGYTFLLGVLSFIMCGITEISLVVIFVLYVYIIFIPSVRKKLFHRQQLFIVFCILAGGIIVIAAPGNLVRMSYFPQGQQFFTSFWIALVSLGKLNGIFFQSIPVLLLSIVILNSIRTDMLPIPLQNIISIHPVLYFFLWQTLLFGGFFVQAWAMGINPPMRVYNTIGFYWLLGGFFFLFSFHHFFTKKRILNVPLMNAKGIRFILFITLIALFSDFVKPPGQRPVFRGNTPAALYDLIFQSVPYLKETNARQKTIQHQINAGKDTIFLKPFQHKPKLVFYLDATDDPEYFVNMLLADYLEVNTIIVSEVDRKSE
jgi:hypothetical protein